MPLHVTAASECTSASNSYTSKEDRVGIGLNELLALFVVVLVVVVVAGLGTGTWLRSRRAPPPPPAPSAGTRQADARREDTTRLGP